MPGQWCQMFVIGSAINSAKAPGRLTPTPCVCAHRWRRPAMQLRQRPQTTWPSPLTMSPGWKSLTLEPTATISPTNSWPTTIGTGIVCCAQASQLVDVHVGAADAGAVHPDQDVVDAVLRLGDVLQPEAGSARLFTSARIATHRIDPAVGFSNLTAHARASLRCPVRAGADRPGHRPKPVLPGAPLQRHGLSRSHRPRPHARHQGRGRLGGGLHRGGRDPRLVRGRPLHRGPALGRPATSRCTRGSASRCTLTARWPGSSSVTTASRPPTATRGSRRWRRRHCRSSGATRSRRAR